MRYERRSTTIPALAEHIDEMATIVERRREAHNGSSQESTETRSTRTLREYVAVMIWEEEDGSETISVVGDSTVGELELKGVLHDGLYAMMHKES